MRPPGPVPHQAQPVLDGRNLPEQQRATRQTQDQDGRTQQVTGPERRQPLRSVSPVGKGQIRPRARIWA
ncbi:hypothetical protein CPA56_08590 [Bombella sp. TMW2.1889]|uniref:Uncharacterized protein n=1 Tax=Bombella mellum TaxID=2039288 RepID=A0ABR5ZUM5_9PROT|nr:hypothetical protein [Bombella mellum]